MTIASNVTFGVNCTGNIQALLICLTSVLQNRLLPAKIQIRFEGEFPSFGNFYLEQLAALAARFHVEFSVSYGASQGVRKARDWQLKNCRTELLWMGDDDCLYSPNCLDEFMWALDHLKTTFSPRDDAGNECCVGYVNGSKPDINNRRGYGDFGTASRSTAQLPNGASMNQFYYGDRTLVRTNTMDTGNVLLSVDYLRKFNIWFDKFGMSYNSGGEDTLMGLHCNHLNAYGFFCPTAVAIHLEKPPSNSNFGEFAARGEMLLRTCELLEISTQGLPKEFMPFIQPK